MKIHKNKVSITIGIPAYNEEKNISFLINSLLKQEMGNVVLEKILVVSDGSTDGTIKQIKTVSDQRIIIIEFKKRRGLAFAQNEILKHVTGKICVMLDADVLPANNRFVSEIIKPIIADPFVGLVGADVVAAKPKGIFERIMVFSHLLKTEVYRRINNGNNLYLCHGRARAFSKDLFSKIKWLSNYSEDSYSYLFCISKGLKFRYASNARAVFRSPTNLFDHARQSTRFHLGKKKMENYFRKSFVKREYSIPISAFFAVIPRIFLKSPFLLSTYLMIAVFMKCIANIGGSHDFISKNSVSTKQVI